MEAGEGERTSFHTFARLARVAVLRLHKGCAATLFVYAILPLERVPRRAAGQRERPDMGQEKHEQPAHKMGPQPATRAAPPPPPKWLGSEAEREATAINHLALFIGRQSCGCDGSKMIIIKWTRETFKFTSRVRALHYWRAKSGA